VGCGEKGGGDGGCGRSITPAGWAVLGQNSKPSRRGSVTGVWLETVIGGNGSGWCGVGNEVVVVVVVRVCNRSRRGRGVMG
jgi:hypothetical protein